MDLVLDESVDSKIEEKLRGRDIETLRPDEGVSDQDALEFSISHGAPILTRDAGDFVQLHRRFDHRGILIDREMHHRDRDLVADTVADMLAELGDELANNVWWISDFYGRQY